MNQFGRSNLRPSKISAAAANRPWLPWLVVFIGLALSYSSMWLPRVCRELGITPGLEGPANSIVWNVLAVSLLLGYVLLIERRPLASLGLRRPQGKDLEWALYLFGFYMAWQWVVLTFWPPAEDSGTASITSLPVVAVAGMIVSAAVCEEILYRGYPIERLSELTRRPWLAYGFTVPLFVLPHTVFFGPQWLWTSGIGALAIYLLYARTRNLPACMLLHLCINLPILIPTIAHRLGG
ncbi:CPBP family intramembrane glutamic endopeptidase [Arthrobacter sp. 08Y14]|uniref:CPBP family intramembrane glutamic endopeptidase n=1 Tax=Arthrobacter sp. 08Y14 TaxID=2058885 RepID=UPI000CE4513C|nr:type II CAAX endopeptidase family protein [Arthrobacter sp. 08Y14]